MGGGRVLTSHLPQPGRFYAFPGAKGAAGRAARDLVIAFKRGADPLFCLRHQRLCTYLLTCTSRDADRRKEQPAALHARGDVVLVALPIARRRVVVVDKRRSVPYLNLAACRLGRQQRRSSAAAAAGSRAGRPDTSAAQRQGAATRARPNSSERERGGRASVQEGEARRRGGLRSGAAAAAAAATEPATAAAPAPAAGLAPNAAECVR